MPLDERVHPLAAVRRVTAAVRPFSCTHTNNRLRETRSAANSAPVRPEIRLKNEIPRAKAQPSSSFPLSLCATRAGGNGGLAGRSFPVGWGKIADRYVATCRDVR